MRKTRLQELAGIQLNEAQDKVDLKMLAEFVKEGLGAVGILDDADEILLDAFEHGGEKVARKALNRYNNAIAFCSQHGIPLKPISEEDFQDILANEL